MLTPTQNTSSRQNLRGMRILVPRADDWGESVAARIRDRAGTPICAPLLETAPPADEHPLQEACRNWNAGGFDWVAVTSANAANALTRAGAHPVPGCRVAAVGPATARALSRAGLPAHLAPQNDYTAAGLATALLEETVPAARILLPLSEIAGKTLQEKLVAAGHDVTRVTAYRTLIRTPDTALKKLVANREVDVALVSSGSCADALAAGFSGEELAGMRLAAIGASSALALTRHGLRAHVVATPHTVEALLDAL